VRIVHVDLDEARVLLGVGPSDEWEAVRLAYRRLIRQQHPDSGHPGATVRAATLNAAYRLLSRALRAETVDGTPPRRSGDDDLSRPRLDVHIEGADTLVIEAAPDDTFSHLLEAAHVVGQVSYVDRSSAIFEILVKHEGETCSFVVSLEGDSTTQAYCTLESMERSQRFSPTPIVRRLAAALSTPWVSQPGSARASGTSPRRAEPRAGVYIQSDDEETFRRVARHVNELATDLGYEQPARVW
jgi:hypothetical protein